MDPNIVVPNTETKIKKNPNLKWLLLLGLFLFALGGTYFYLKSGTINYKQDQWTFTNTASPSPRPSLSPRTKIEDTIKQTFTTSETKDVISYLNRASAEPTPDKAYVLYKKTFEEMGKAYQNTKNVTYKYAMIDLKAFLSTFTIYKPNDFVIPK